MQSHHPDPEPPLTPSELWQRALKHHQQGELELAEGYYRQLLERHPKHVDTLHYYGLLLHQQGKTEQALDYLRLALQQQADAEAIQNNFLAVLLSLEDIEHYQDRKTILAVAERLLARKPNKIDVLKNIGKVYFRLGLFEKSASVLRQVVELDSNELESLKMLIDCSAKRGDDELALQYAKQVLTIDRDQYRVFNMLTSLQRFKQAWQETDYYVEKIQSPDTNDTTRVYLGFALGKMFDDLGEYERAFGCYRIANDSSEWTDECSIIEQRYQNIAHKFDNKLVASLAPGSSDSEIPLFVLGMPRSGSTLVEQILSSHSQVYPGGERKEIREAFYAQAGSDINKWINMEDELIRLGPQGVSRMAAFYLEMVRKTSNNCLRFVDKMPPNFLNIGLIKILFPKARIIYTRRHPLDVILSCYFQPFTDGNRYAFRLDSLVAYYNLHNRFMRFWKEYFPNILEVRYEDMITQAEEKTREIIGFAGLSWEENCLQHHKANSRVPHTASHWQARQPIYQSSLNRWQHYQQYLSPYMDQLEDDVYFPKTHHQATSG
ncbi:MAG: sulfotransferase [Gammaproteobacteria bacterium]|nr:sulfotransferase [Gammaproteobacteria bacterium]